ncbi:hypothetical protein [Candidatus Oscillochloris fontis]|uniref:hypothetical protein n=1 Tax=Candidatus Oscillochloris fontis TaxID=2496868 RepID=UPI00101D4009|nr:hypothetical protein [Candidatus Oscillochloris fontis]
MPDVLALVEHKLLDQRPPRRLPFFFLPNLLGEYLLERPLRFYLDPIMIGGLLLVVVFLFLEPAAIFWWTLGLILLLRFIAIGWVIYRGVREDYLLMRFGVVTQAHVMGMRFGRDASGELSGAYLDCVIPIGPRRTSVGSVWMPDTNEAQRIATIGNLRVICLQRAPGTWRLREGDGPHLRYEPNAPKLILPD